MILELQLKVFIDENKNSIAFLNFIFVATFVLFCFFFVKININFKEYDKIIILKND